MERLGQTPQRATWTKIPARRPIYEIQINTDTSDAERDLLRQQVSKGAITGFLWLTDDALARHQVTYSTKEAADFGQSSELRNAIRTAVTRGAWPSRA